MRFIMNSLQAPALFFKVIFTVVLFGVIEPQLEEWKNVPCGVEHTPAWCVNASLDKLKRVVDFELCGPALLEPNLRDYVWSASSNERTFYENKEAYGNIHIKKRVLQGNSDVSLETTLFGRKIGFPLGVAPTSGQSFYHPEGEIGVARGAANLSTVMVLSSLSITLLEDVAAAVPPDAEIWMQVYLNPKRDLVYKTVKRAERAGFKAIVMTVDLPVDYSALRCDSFINFRDNYTHGMMPNVQPGPLPPDFRQNDPKATFEYISWMKGITDLPLVAKGIMYGEDAIEAVKAGASAVWVSNHGGRAVDGALPSIDALPGVVRALKPLFPDIPVFVDGGVRFGHDVFSALARGATMAFIGRPAIWGLTVAGSNGVEKVLTILKKDFEITLIHAGLTKPNQINPDHIFSKWNYNDLPFLHDA